MSDAITDPAEVPSPLDELRTEFAEEVKEKRLWKRLPARKERLAAEYQPLPLKDARRAIEQQSDPMVIASSLVNVCIYDPDHPLVMQADPRDERAQRGLVLLGAWAQKPDLDPLGFDARLCGLLGVPTGSATDILLMLFEGNDLALAAHAAELGEWSVRTSREELQDFPKTS